MLFSVICILLLFCKQQMPLSPVLHSRFCSSSNGILKTAMYICHLASVYLILFLFKNDKSALARLFMQCVDLLFIKVPPKSFFFLVCCSCCKTKFWTWRASASVVSAEHISSRHGRANGMWLGYLQTCIWDLFEMCTQLLPREACAEW